MKERPIIFSAPMVRAFLAGTKTQTRRVVKLPRAPDHLGQWEPFWFGGAGCKDSRGNPISGRWTIGHSRTGAIIGCPYGGARDRLWVREAFRFPSSLDRLSPADVGEKAVDAGYAGPWAPTLYEADGARTGSWSTFHTPPTDTVPGKLRNSLHMPRWASRITLELTEVRVERLQDISVADAIAEGAPPSHPSIDVISREFGYPDFTRSWYAQQLWEQINGPGSWKANPWVWALSFKRITP
jgi:hypothetical protein